MSDTTTTAPKTLADLKVGDEAVIVRGHGHTTARRIVTVSAVTPSGRIKTADGSEFNPDGRQRGAAHDPWRGTPRIVPLTPDLRSEIEDDAERSRLQVVIHNWATGRAWQGVSTVDLRRVADLIAEIEGKAAQRGNEADQP